MLYQQRNTAENAGFVHYIYAGQAVIMIPAGMAIAYSSPAVLIRNDG